MKLELSKTCKSAPPTLRRSDKDDDFEKEQFREWCNNNSADATDIRQAAEHLQFQLEELLADSASAVVHDV